jgi:hypothetical protein
MIILVTGSRNWSDYATILEALAYYEGQPDITVRHGACPTGADLHADKAAKYLRFEIDPMPADWKRFRNAAGYIRNAEMVKKDPKPGVCLAFGVPCFCTVVPGKHVSHGTRHCAHIAKEAGIEVKRYKSA